MKINTNTLFLKVISIYYIKIIFNKQLTDKEKSNKCFVLTNLIFFIDNRIRAMKNKDGNMMNTAKFLDEGIIISER